MLILYSLLIIINTSTPSYNTSNMDLLLKIKEHYLSLETYQDNIKFSTVFESINNKAYQFEGEGKIRLYFNQKRDFSYHSEEEAPFGLETKKILKMGAKQQIRYAHFYNNTSVPGLPNMSLEKAISMLRPNPLVPAFLVHQENKMQHPFQNYQLVGEIEEVLLNGVVCYHFQCVKHKKANEKKGVYYQLFLGLVKRLAPSVSEELYASQEDDSEIIDKRKFWFRKDNLLLIKQTSESRFRKNIISTTFHHSPQINLIIPEAKFSWE